MNSHPVTTLAKDRRYRQLCIAVALLCAATIFYGLGSIPLLSLNEARRALPITAMFHSGNWLLPTLNGELYIDKPPFYYWCSLLFAQAFNTVNEWIFRLPSAIAALAMLAGIFAVAHKAAGRWVALFTVIILASNNTFLQFARGCEIELLLTALCCGALLLAWHYMAVSASRFSLYASYALSGAAILCKGPVALLFVQLPILVMAFRQTEARRYLASPIGWLLLLGIGLSWYGDVTWQYGRDIWEKVFHVDIKGKVQGNPNADPFYIYAQSLLGDFFPWSLLLLLTPRRTVSAWWHDAQQRFFFIATLLPFIVLSLFSDKHGKYLLPVYPLFALLLAHRLGVLMSGWQARTRRLLIGSALLLMTGYLLFFTALQDRLMNYRYAAMPAITSLSEQYPQAQLISHKEVDMRTVYYYGRPIPVVQQADITAALQGQQPTILLLEKTKQRKELQLDGWQTMSTLSPYISKDQTAELLVNPAFMALYE